MLSLLLNIESYLSTKISDLVANLSTSEGLTVGINALTMGSGFTKFFSIFSPIYFLIIFH